MKRLATLLYLPLLAAAAITVYAGGITGYVSSADVRNLTVEALQTWANDPINATGCGGGDCCPGASDPQCEAFALKVRANATHWAQLVEREYKLDGDWACETELASVTSNVAWTVCTTVSGTPLVDVSRIASEFAAQEEAP